MCQAAQHRFIPDELGSPLQTTTPGGNTYRNAYDALGRITQTTRPDTKSVSYAYTAQDQLASVTDPLGHATRYTRNNLGDLQRLDSPDTGGATTTYDPSGLPLSAHRCAQPERQPQLRRCWSPQQHHIGRRQPQLQLRRRGSPHPSQ